MHLISMPWTCPSLLSSSLSNNGIPISVFWCSKGLQYDHLLPSYITWAAWWERRTIESGVVYRREDVKRGEEEKVANEAVKGQSTHQINKTFWCPSNNLCTTLWCGRSSQQYLEEWQQSRKIPKQPQFNPDRYWEEQIEILQGLDLDPGRTHIFTLSTLQDMHDQWGFCAHYNPLEASLYILLISTCLLGKRTGQRQNNTPHFGRKKSIVV